jgi:CRP/FNR family transcriptional regulator, cyclic AMP receptor protein
MSSAVAVDLRPAGVQAAGAKAPPVWRSNTKSKTKQAEEHAFDAQAFLDSASMARKAVEYRSNVAVFTQGDPATSVLYIRKGALKVTVVNGAGKEAVVAILGTGDFLGEGCLAGQSHRVNTAETITRSTILRIDKWEMIRVFHEQHEFSDQFITYMVARNIRAVDDLLDQLFISSEKRLARTLLLLARNGNQ